MKKLTEIVNDEIDNENQEQSENKKSLVLEVNLEIDLGDSFEIDESEEFFNIDEKLEEAIVGKIFKSVAPHIMRKVKNNPAVKRKLDAFKKKQEKYGKQGRMKLKAKYKEKAKKYVAQQAKKAKKKIKKEKGDKE